MRFSVGNSLKAMGWVCVWLTVCMCFNHWWSDIYDFPMFMLGIIALPFVAVGQLFGKPGTGLMLGILAVLIFLLFVFSFSWKVE
jgi:hypothetical protein